MGKIKLHYEKPAAETLDVRVEAGFASTPSATGNIVTDPNAVEF